jgi:hypothetical protein
MQRALVASAFVFCALVVWIGIGTAQFNPNAPAKPPANLSPSQPGSLLAPPGNTNIGIPSQNIPQPAVREDSNSTESKKKKDQLTGKGTPGKDTGKPAGKVTGKKETPGTGRANVDTSKKLEGRATELPTKSQLPIDPDAVVPPGFPQNKEMLDLMKKGPLEAGNLPGGPPGPDRPEFPKTEQPRGPKRGLPMTIGGAPAPFNNPSGQAGQDGSWVQVGSPEKTNDGGTRTEWKHSKTGETKTSIRRDKSKDEGSTTTMTHNPRTGASTTVERAQYRDKDGKLVRSETTNEKRKTSEGWKNVNTERYYDMKGREIKSKRKVWMPNEGGGRSSGGIICFTELQCRDAMEKAQKAREKRPGPGGMPTETTGIPGRSGPGTGPGAATDPNPDDLGIRGGGGGGGGQSGPPVYCVGEDCERPSDSGTGSKPPVPGGPSR